MHPIIKVLFIFFLAAVTTCFLAYAKSYEACGRYVEDEMDRDFEVIRYCDGYEKELQMVMRQRPTLQKSNRIDTLKKCEWEMPMAEARIKEGKKRYKSLGCVLRRNLRPVRQVVLGVRDLLW